VTLRVEDRMERASTLASFSPPTAMSSRTCKYRRVAPARSPASLARIDVERRIRWGGGETQGLIKMSVCSATTGQSSRGAFDLIQQKTRQRLQSRPATKLSGPQPTDVQIWSTGLKSPSEIASWDNKPLGRRSQLNASQKACEPNHWVCRDATRLYGPGGAA